MEQKHTKHTHTFNRKLNQTHTKHTNRQTERSKFMACSACFSRFVSFTTLTPFDFAANEQIPNLIIFQTGTMEGGIGTFDWDIAQIGSDRVTTGYSKCKFMTNHTCPVPKQPKSAPNPYCAYRNTRARHKMSYNHALFRPFTDGYP